MRFLIADDHAIVRKGLIQLLREEFTMSEVREVANGNDALGEARKQPWDAILLDISMPGRSGIEILKEIRAYGVKTPILIISMYPEEQYAIRALKAGASGFLNKESANEELLAAVHTILGGRRYISPIVADKLADALGDMGEIQAYELLSDREMQVLHEIASGKTVSEIAKQFALSVNTISTYRTRILEKLSLNNNAELTRYAIDHRLA
jgi:two-component system, NarL family, invasion response regulator UvrY